MASIGRSDPSIGGVGPVGGTSLPSSGRIPLPKPPSTPPPPVLARMEILEPRPVPLWKPKEEGVFGGIFEGMAFVPVNPQDEFVVIKPEPPSVPPPRPPSTPPPVLESESQPLWKPKESGDTAVDCTMTFVPEEPRSTAANPQYEFVAIKPGPPSVPPPRPPSTPPPSTLKTSIQMQAREKVSNPKQSVEGLQRALVSPSILKKELETVQHYSELSKELKPLQEKQAKLHKQLKELNAQSPSDRLYAGGGIRSGPGLSSLAGTVSMCGKINSKRTDIMKKLAALDVRKQAAFDKHTGYIQQADIGKGAQVMEKAAALKGAVQKLESAYKWQDKRASMGMEPSRVQQRDVDQAKLALITALYK